MANARIHARNLAANWISQAANLVVMFFLSPFVVHTLGQVQYGIWSLLTVVTGYMGVLDLGVRASTGRHIILHLGRGDQKAADETIRTSMTFFSYLGFIVLAAGVGIGYVFPSMFRSVPSEYHGTIAILLPLLAINVWVSAIQGVFSSLLITYERFDLTRAIDLVVLGVRTVGTIVVLKLGYGIAGLAAVVVIAHLLGLVGNYLLACKIHPQLRCLPLVLQRERVRELLGYGSAAFITSVSHRLIGQTDLFIVGAAISVASVTIYSVGAMLVFYSSTFLAQIGVTLFPAIQRAAARDELGSTRWLFQRAGRLGMVFGLLGYVGMIVFSESFIRLWMHGPGFDDDAVRSAGLIMSILAAAKLPLLFVGASGAVLRARGHIRVTATLASTEAIANIACSLLFVFVFDWGLIGIALGTLAARLLIGTFIAPRVACKLLGLDWWDYVRNVGGPGLFVAVCFFAICVSIREFIPGTTWVYFVIQASLATAAYAALAFWLLVPSTDRDRMWRVLRRGRLTQDAT